MTSAIGYQVGAIPNGIVAIAPECARYNPYYSENPYISHLRFWSQGRRNVAPYYCINAAINSRRHNHPGSVKPFVWLGENPERLQHKSVALCERTIKIIPARMAPMPFQMFMLDLVVVCYCKCLTPEKARVLDVNSRGN